MTVRASILIPTHDRAQTLRIAVSTALAQTVLDLEVLIIGDGVTDGVRTAANELARQDSRVRFFDNPKGANHGEPYRHDAIVHARGGAIFYLCDDDLLMAEHVSDLLELLETHDFVQSLNGFVTIEGEIGLYPADLADPETVQRHLSDEVPFNNVSLTGTAHSRDFYLRMVDPWTTTPKGFWPDQYQARKFFRAPGCRSATSRRMTALQFPTLATARETWPEKDRVVELLRWIGLTITADGQEQINERVAASTRRRLDREYQRATELSVSDENHRRLAASTRSRLDLEHQRATELTVSDENHRRLAAEYRAELQSMLASRSWRATAPLRWLRRVVSSRRWGG